jgi:hypothetical protein
MPYGMFKGEVIGNLEDDYLCTIVKQWKGGFLAKNAGQKPFTPPDEIYLEAKRILKDRGYNTKGVEPVKET